MNQDKTLASPMDVVLRGRGVLERENAIAGVYAGDRSDELQDRVEDIAGRCTIATDNAMLEGGSQ